MAGFGESLVTTGPISGEVVYIGRGCDPAYQAGQPLDPYLADPAGKIALIDRGSCEFVAKVRKAEENGAHHGDRRQQHRRPADRPWAAPIPPSRSRR